MDLENGIKEYNLEKPIMVHVNNEGEREVHLITLHEPKRCHMRYSTKMSQMITRAIFEAREMQEKITDTKENKEIAGDEIKPFHERTSEEHEEICSEFKVMISVALHGSEKVELDVFVDNFVKMATKVGSKNIVLCDDEIPIKETHFDQMSAYVVLDMALTYASFFLMPSVMQGK